MLKRLAKRRGERSQRRKKFSRPRAVASTPSEAEERVGEALKRSVDLVYADEFSNTHFPLDALTSFLEEVKEREKIEPQGFLREGISRLSTPTFVSQVKERLQAFQRSADDVNPQDAPAAVVLKAIEAGVPPSSIPLIAALFIRDVKDHPLSDDARIWKLIYPFLPSRILAPEKPIEEKKESKYPHIILPESFK